VASTETNRPHSIAIAILEDRHFISYTANPSGVTIRGIAIDDARLLATELVQLQEKLTMIQDQIDLYDMSRNDNEAGLMPEEVLNAIINIIEYGHPAGKTDE
jgi:hypothetical protein